eukprot:766305-Hanusia_phi.AAC.8
MLVGVVLPVVDHFPFRLEITQPDKAMLNATKRFNLLCSALLCAALLCAALFLFPLIPCPLSFPFFSSSFPHLLLSSPLFSLFLPATATAGAGKEGEVGR